ncbi:hypothetical protein PV326_006985, partial [Microctonus aethiopoides]
NEQEDSYRRLLSTSSTSPEQQSSTETSIQYPEYYHVEFYKNQSSFGGATETHLVHSTKGYWGNCFDVLHIVKYSGLTMVTTSGSTEWNFVECTKGYRGCANVKNTITPVVGEMGIRYRRRWFLWAWPEVEKYQN